MTVADWALTVSMITLLVNGVVAFATWRYAKDTRTQLAATTQPVVVMALRVLPADDTLRPTTNPETYLRISFTNTHSSVRVLELKYTISVAVEIRPSARDGVVNRDMLKYRIYHEEAVGMMDPGAIWSTEVQFGKNKYTKDAQGQRPSGPGMETFINNYLPEYREQQVTGSDKDPILATRVDFSFKSASRGSDVFSERWYSSMLVGFGTSGKLQTAILTEPSTLPNIRH